MRAMLSNTAVPKTVQRKYETGETCEMGEIFQHVFPTTYVVSIGGVDSKLPTILHRLDKADTREGIKSIQPVADLGVPYPLSFSLV